MNLLAQLGNTFVVAAVGALVLFYMRGRFEELKRENRETRAEISELRANVERKFELTMSEIRGVRSEVNSVRSEVNGVRSDLTYVALAVGARPRPEANPA